MTTYISREEVEKILCDADDYTIIERIRNLPSLPDVASQWIHVSERLPEKDVDVLISGEGSIRVGSLWCTGNFYCGSDECDVTHWQPLPLPPK